MILGTDTRKQWSADDLTIAEAYHIMQSERCQQCGLPKWICHNEDSDIYFKTVDDTCFATRELESIDESKRKNKKYSPPKGVRVRPEPHTFSKKPFDPEMREKYYDSLQPAAV